MKATATVSPLFNFEMRSNKRSNSPPANEEGSFAAALRKLAQQTPNFPGPHSGGFQISPALRERLNSSPPSKGEVMSPHQFPHGIPPPSVGIHRASNIVPPVVPIPTHRHSDKETLTKSPLKERHHRRSQDHHHRRSRGSFEDSLSSSVTSSGGSILPSSSLKDRPASSVGLVHPQPIRNLQEEENNKSNVMSSMHYPPRDSIPGLHSLSSSELSRFAPFPIPHHQNQHSQGPQSCPVHGHEGGHQREEKNGRLPLGLPYDLPAHLSRDLHSLHAQHPRLREELQFMHSRHSQERKEHAPSQHSFEEDLRRPGIDYRWAGLPPHLLDEHYRRHLLNSGHSEHSPPFKEPVHGKMVFPPMYYSLRNEHPLHVDPYFSPHGLPGQSEIHRRHNLPSPRALVYPKRELSDRIFNEYEKEQSQPDEGREKEQSEHLTLSERRKLEENSTMRQVAGNPRHERNRNFGNNHSLNSDKPGIPIIKGLDYNAKRDSLPHTINSIDQTKLPDPKTELAAASILANMNRINHSPCSEEVDSITSSSGNEAHTANIVKTEFRSMDEITDEPSEQKEHYMLALGLVSQARKRALTEDIDRRRWERKMRRFRGRPKKRSRRETTKESNDEGSVASDVRSSSELDFYSGPMTRHKQQLLQEQENLFEQIQKRNSIDDNSDVNDNVIKNSDISNTVNVEKSEFKNSRKKSQESLFEVIPVSNSGEIKSPILALTDTSTIVESKTVTPTSTIPIQSEMREMLEKKRLIDMFREKSLFPTQMFPEMHQYDHPKHLEQNKHHSLELPKQYSNLHHMDFVEDIKFLDNSLFGRHPEKQTDAYIRWPGIEPLAHAYTAYMSEHDNQRQHVLQILEDLQREGHCLHQKQEYLEKDKIVYNERQLHIAEKRREMTYSVNALNRALRNIANL